MEAFFAHVRQAVYGGRISHQSQVDGIKAILEETANEPITHRAYYLATAYRETGGAMQPNKENLNYTTASRIRAVWPSRFPTEKSAEPFVRNPQGLANKVYNGRLGNAEGSDDGWTYRGHGLIHITGRDNFERMGDRLGLDLVGNPELACDHDLAVRIMIIGMQEGIFTGKKIGDYLPGDYIGARAVVNGNDHAHEIAKNAKAFEDALRLAEKPQDAPAVVVAPTPAPEPAVPAPAPAEPLDPSMPTPVEPAKPWYASTGVWGGIIALLAGAGAFGEAALTSEAADGLAQIAADFALASATAIGAAVAIIGRVKATKQIGASK